MSGAAQKSQGARPKVHKDNLQPSTKTADTSSSTDNAAASAADEDGDDNRPEASGGGSDRSTGSPEPNCAICLGALENKSFTDSCFHMFCFVCLQESSKVKPECPLCKQPFKSIIHNVKSYNNYDQFYLEHHPPAAPPMRFGCNYDCSSPYNKWGKPQMCNPYYRSQHMRSLGYEESSVTTLSNPDSSSSNSDVVDDDDDDDDAEEAGRPGQAEAMAAAVAGPSTPRRSPQFSGSLWEDQRFANFFNSSSTSMARSGWDSPTPGPSWDLGGTTSQLPVSVDTSSDSEASTIINPTYIPQHTPDSRPQRSRSPGVSDGEDVIFVSYDKTWEERSPIQLSSGSDDEALSKVAKRLKREHKKKKKMRATVTSDCEGNHGIH